MRLSAVSKFIAVFWAVSTFSVGLSVAAEVAQPDWRKIDRIGLYKSSEQGQVVDDIWENYSQAEAVALLDKFPSSLSGAAYRAVVSKTLLSDSSDSRKDIASPALLSRRLSLLIRYGLFQQAKNLLAAIPQDFNIQADPDLALIKFQLDMTEPDYDPAPFCLDVQAMGTEFPESGKIRELSNFCSAYFAKDRSERVDTALFQDYPGLGYVLNRDPFPKDYTPRNIEFLLRDAVHPLSPESYDLKAKAAGRLSDISVALYIMPKYKENATYQCYVLEAAGRGIISAEELARFYQTKPFPKEQVNSNDGNVSILPCDIPAFFYQRMALLSSDDSKKETVNALLEATEDMPAYALVPFAKDIATYATGRNHWRGAVILGLAGVTIPDSFLPIAKPLVAIQSAQKLSIEDYEAWLNVQLHRDVLDHYKVDYAAPLYFLQIINGEKNNLKENFKKNEYEKLFSLTYAKKSIHLGLGFDAYIANLYRNEDIVAVFSYVFNLIGKDDVRSLAEDDLAVILSALKAYKLEKESVMLSLEYLQ